MLLLFFACQNIYSPDKISGPWTVSDFQFEEDMLGLETAIQGLSFQYTFGTADAGDFHTGLYYSGSDDFDSYSEEDADDLWAFCYTGDPSPTLSCNVSPILMYQDQWLHPIENLLGFTEECFQRSNLDAVIVSENEIRSTASISIDCDQNKSHADTTINYAYYTAHWTR